MNISPEENEVAIVSEIKNRKMNLGMVCLRWLPEALGKANEGKHLIDLYTNTTWEVWQKTLHKEQQ
ncbi:MAG: hypothetical protein ACKVG0_05735 [Alphaproteobacteria bacterium]